MGAEAERLRREVARGAGPDTVLRLLRLLEAGASRPRDEALAKYVCDDEDAADGVYLVRHKVVERIESNGAETFGYRCGREFPDAEIAILDIDSHGLAVDGLAIVVFRRGMAIGEARGVASRAWKKRLLRQLSPYGLYHPTTGDEEARFRAANQAIARSIEAAANVVALGYSLLDAYADRVEPVLAAYGDIGGLDTAVREDVIARIEGAARSRSEAG